MKGNDGRGSRDRLRRRAILAALAIFSFLSCMWLMDIFVEDVISSGRSLRSIDDGVLSLEDYMERKKGFGKKKQKILDAEYTLIGVKYEKGNFDPSDTHSYSGIIGKFCKLNFASQKESPSTVPMFKDILAVSPGCDKPFEIDLKSITKEARNYDAVIKKHNEQEADLKPIPKVLNLTGAVFHESRCGSTLVANTLVAMDTKRHRVYSESAPPIYAMARLCDTFDCAPGLSARVLKDIIYMMSRSNDENEERVFFKIQSKGSWYIQEFRLAFPTVPWMFVYRESVEVMMSQFRGNDKNKANCVSYKEKPNVYIKQVAERYEKYQKTTNEELTLDEFCAIHLASLTENAVKNLKESDGVGHSINYVDLPNIMYQKVLPDLWGVPVDEEQKDRIIEVSQKYSKARDDEEKQTWKEDSQRKEEAATPEIRLAAETIMGPSYHELESFKPQIQ